MIMIKNVIFDFGQVLVHFDPEYMTSKYIEKPEDISLVSQVIFDRLYWDRLDEGTISDEEVIAESAKRLPPEYSEKAAEIYYNWIYNIPPVGGMEELILELKEKNIRLFLLSNISRYFADHAHEIKVLSHFEKCIFSAVCGYTKPNPGIFEYLCSQAGISPSETVFIDDSEKNILGAENFGIKGCLFDGNVQKLKAYLKESGVL